MHLRRDYRLMRFVIILVNSWRGILSESITLHLVGVDKKVPVGPNVKHLAIVSLSFFNPFLLRAREMITAKDLQRENSFMM